MDFRSLWITGDVHIEADLPLAETAAKLGEALAVSFEEDPAGRFDEFPSFSAEVVGLSLVLLGIPDPEDQLGDEPITAYALQIQPEFTSGESHIPCDASGYFADLIRERTGLKLTES